MYDAIIIGARCAGAATAFLLARQGLKVLLVDKAALPCEIPHGHFIHRHGPRLLKRWNLLEGVIGSGSLPITKMTLDLGDFPLTGTDLVRDGVAFGYGPRRKVLDRVLVEGAVAAGAEFRPGFLVDDYLMDGTTAVGIRGRSQETSAHIAENARITIGADGRNSPLARAFNAPAYEETPALTCWYFSYWSGCVVEGLEVYVRGRNVIFTFPSNDGLTAVFIAWDVCEFERVRSNIELSFMGVLSRVPDLEQRICCGRREERFYGAADLPNFFRKPYGPGWALVGDAGNHKDPFLALGICDAFRDAELLASAVEEGFGGKRPLVEALQGYEEQRNAAAMADYRENISFAQFKPVPDQVLAIRAAIRGNQQDTNNFFLAREGMIPPGDFFNPENIGRLKGRLSARA